MNFKTAILTVAAPALMLTACTQAETEAEAAGGETSEPAGATGANAADQPDEAVEAPATDEVSKPDIVRDPDAKAAPNAGKPDGTWTCEDQGDVEVTFKRFTDGTGRLIYVNMSEMAANQEATMVNLEATGASAGYDDRSGRMQSGDGSSTVWFMNDGRVEVTQGKGADAITYMCDKAG